MITKTIPFTEDVFDLFMLFKEESHLFFLDSSLTASPNGRYSFIGFDPFEVFEGRNLADYQRFKECFKNFVRQDTNPVMPFHSGAVGYLSYDLGLLFQGIVSLAASGSALPLFHFGFYDVILAVDHLQQTLCITSTGFPEKTSLLQQARAKERMDQILSRIRQLSPAPGRRSYDNARKLLPPPVFTSNVTRDEYIHNVHRALEHIRQGDIYEVNLSHKILADVAWETENLRPWEIYSCLRELSPSHFSAYYHAGNHQLLSTSPERFLSLKNGTAQIRPMKGTRPRGKTPEEDSLFRQELMHSPKEIAELLMVTDLERNDLGRVCDFGSVRVKEMRAIEEYKTVFQATSCIEGMLRKDKGCFDLLEACFPGGSVTGCPKISAMKIIDDIEKVKRGIYTGAFGYIDFSGNLDFNILIRTLLLSDKEISFHVGGGIVADSNSQLEYEETWLKAKAMMECLTVSPARRSL
ncbi:MAG: anthranilate synthase component I family protein [Candidatus Omnitrophica bacterium]|nr:anthranilate synthase component I family protein [Candidatus Omnitrophota bacterium]